MNAVTIRDLSLGEIGLPKPLEDLRNAYFQAAPEICTERPALITRRSREAGFFARDRITVLDKARLYKWVLEHRRPIVWHTTAHRRTSGGMHEFAIQDSSPFAGSTTSKFKGVLMYPEFLGLSLWPELGTISRRKSNPYYISEEEIKTLNFDVFPHWMNHTIAELARARGSDEDRRRMQFLQRFVFFLASKPNCISHTIPDFSRAVNEGLRALIADARRRGERAGDQYTKDFYTAIAEVLEGIIGYARNLAAAAESMTSRETDPARKTALAEIARIYRRVPEHPAETFREGLTTVWVCWTAAHLENPNAGLSLGRLDQLFYQLYRRDIQANRLTVEKAVELLGYLWLKIGDHVPMVPNDGE